MKTHVTSNERNAVRMEDMATLLRRNGFVPPEDQTLAEKELMGLFRTVPFRRALGSCTVTYWLRGSRRLVHHVERT